CNLYQGDDYLSYWKNEERNNSFTAQTEEFRNKILDIWGNFLLTAKLQTNLSSRLMAKHNLSYTRYRTKDLMSASIKTADSTMENTFIYKSSVQELSFYSDWNYRASRYWDLSWGGKFSWISHIPNEVVKNYEKPYLEGIKSLQNALDLTLYTDQIIKPLSWMDIRLGLRLNYYVLKEYSHFSFDPRASVSFFLPKEQALNIGYSRLTQTSQMLFVPGPVINNEIWFSSDQFIPIAYSNQYNVGWSGFFYKRMFEVEVSLYYKSMEGLSTFKEGYRSITGDPLWKDKISINGSGRSYGVEMSLSKTLGKWTGIATYSYARSFRKFADINQGKEFAFDFDRPHTATLSLNWAINTKWSLSCSWIYQTGLPYTPAVERIYVPNTDLKVERGGVLNEQTDPIEYYEVLVYGERNSARMKAYHRMDLGAQYSYTTKKGRRACWSFSIYNLYARKNPAFYFYNEVGHPSIGEIYNPRVSKEFKPLSQYQVYYLSLVPMISYKVWFDTKTEQERRKAKVKKSYWQN
ncbi:MAG: TonB-dependent receptor, partial [Bacteroidales bacterium]